MVIFLRRLQVAQLLKECWSLFNEVIEYKISCSLSEPVMMVASFECLVTFRFGWHWHSWLTYNFVIYYQCLILFAKVTDAWILLWCQVTLVWKQYFQKKAKHILQSISRLNKMSSCIDWLHTCTWLIISHSTVTHISTHILIDQGWN